MNKKFLILGVTGIALILLASYIFLNFQQKDDASNNSTTSETSIADLLAKQSEENGVGVDVVLQNPIMTTNEDSLLFEVSFTTHSGDLTGYDIVNSVYLTNNNDLKVESGFLWESSSDDSHHRAGLLKLPLTQEIKDKISQSSSLVLVIKDLANVPERSLEWDQQVVKKLSETLPNN